MTAREIMSREVVTIHDDARLEDAAKLMLARNIGCLPVLNARDAIVGIVTESDFAAKEKAIPFSLARFPQLLGEWLPKAGVEGIYEAARRTPVRAIMSRNVVSLTEEEPLEAILEKMLASGFHRLPVVKDGKPVGIVARHDLLRVMLSRMKSPS